MKFPKLKNPILCMIVLIFLPFVVLVGVIVALVFMNFIPEKIRVFIGLGFAGIYIFLFFKNFTHFVDVDLRLSLYRYHRNARKWFALPNDFVVQEVNDKICSFGQACSPAIGHISPQNLQYKSKKSITIFASGYEKVIATYDVDRLDKNSYREIVQSAKANSLALRGHKSYNYLDRRQQNAPLNRVTIAVIYAQQVDSSFRDGLLEAICNDVGNNADDAFLVCVVDLDRRICVFDSMQECYLQARPAKNRGIRLIKKLLFNNKFTYDNSPEMLDTALDIDPEQSIWAFWKSIKNELANFTRETNDRFAKMTAGDVVFEEDCMYLKWGEMGVLIFAETNDQTKTANVEPFTHWDYPKAKQMDANSIQAIKAFVDDYFHQLGYTTNHITYDEE